MQVRANNIIILVPLLLMVFGQLMFKLGSGDGGFFNIFVVIGYLALLTRSAIWIAVLRRLPLSFAYPVMSLSFVLVLLASNYLFNEALTVPRIIGSVLIIAGVFSIYRGMKKGEQ